MQAIQDIKMFKSCDLIPIKKNSHSILMILIQHNFQVLNISLDSQLGSISEQSLSMIITSPSENHIIPQIPIVESEY